MGNCICNSSDSKSQTHNTRNEKNEKNDKNDKNDIEITKNDEKKNDEKKNDEKKNDEKKSDEKKNDIEITKNDENKNDENKNNDVDIYSLCTDENTFYFNYEKLRKKVKILRVIDGDTVDIAMSLVELKDSKDIYKYRVRLYGIDTPEKRPPKNDPNRDKEIAASKRSSEALNNYLRENDYIVIAQFYKPDKYGRLLATFYDKNGDDINKWMVSNGYAYEYFGKTKEKFVAYE